jgi:hypothetical protein
VAVPLLLGLVGDRQADLSSAGGTGQQRIQFWLEALMIWKRTPISMVAGVGGGCVVEYMRPPHNSFLQAYVDLGFVGGTLFLGAFSLGLWRLYQLRPRAGERPPRLWRRQAAVRSGQGARPELIPGAAAGRVIDLELERIRPFLIGAMTSYALGIASTNHTYTVATYEVLGLVAAYIRIADPTPSASAGSMVLDGRMVGRLCLASIVFLILMMAYAQLMVRW